MCRTTSHLHLHVFTSAHLHFHIFTSAHLHLCSSSHQHIYISAHLHICTSTSSHLHISHLRILSLFFFVSLLRRRRCRRSTTKRNDRACRGHEMQVRLRFCLVQHNPLRRSCVSRAQNAGEIAFWIRPTQPSAEIVRVEGAKYR